MYLSKSAYGNKKSSLSHLFRLENGIGFPRAFLAEPTNLFRGFFREVVLRKTRGPRNNNHLEGRGNKEGKEPMSVALYKSCLEWFLGYGTRDGVFAYCFLVLTWNLSCRAGNTARMQFSDVSWNESFDSYSVSFSHSKTDQLGDEAKYPRHLFANPLTPLVCPVLSLAMYISCCFNTVQVPGNCLFAGANQDARFAHMLSKAVNDNWLAVARLGYIRGDIGSHSIRKGSVSYLASLPGGPPAAAVSIRAGWTMGKIKDIYMRYVTSGDEFVGRCLSLLSVLRTDFGISPPHFISDCYEWIEPGRCLQFPMLSMVNGWERITTMCLASLLHHHGWLSNKLQVNHCFLVSSHIHGTRDLLAKSEIVQISYPWEDMEHVYVGVPPHLAILHEIQLV
jgi:hypothetical protein